MRAKLKTITLSKLILKKLGELGAVTISGFFPEKYPEAKLWRNLLGLDESYKFSQNNFSKILSKLQKQGFVIKSNGSTRNTKWGLTKKGKRYLTELEQPNILPASDGIRRVVIFDIPERERGKRYLLRAELTALNYRPLQRSVWIGDIPLPRDFFKILDQYNLKKYIHIFSIRDEGTL